MPKPVLTAADGNHDLIQVSDIFSGRPLSAQLLRVCDPKFAASSTARFVGHDNTALQQHFLDQTQAQRGLEIKPDRMGGDLWRKAVVLIADGRFFLILAGQVGFALIFAVAFAVIPAVMSELLPTEVRRSGASVGYNLCLGLFGGTTPLVATYLVARTADDFAPVYYLMAAAALQILGLTGMRETARKPLPGSG